MATRLKLTDIPALARGKEAMQVFELQKQVPTTHVLYYGDSRDMSVVADESVHLVVTSPPYWILKKYKDLPGQLGVIGEYETFLDELDGVWKEVYRVLVPGGRLVCVVGDVCLPRRTFGRHTVIPLHADIVVRCRRFGFDNLAPIFWYKIANAQYEANTRSSILGKPYEPNAIIKNDVEFILMLRKPGGYRKPTDEQRRLSLIPRELYGRWFRQLWDIRGESTRTHPAPFPLELALRLVRMFSFVGDTVLDPFAGTCTTPLAAMEAGRNSIGFEIDPDFVDVSRERLSKALASLYRRSQFRVSELMTKAYISPPKR